MHDFNISVLSDFPVDQVSLEEEEGISNVINEIIDEKNIENDVRTCITNILDNVQKSVRSSK